MHYYEVWVADSKYKGVKPLTYSYDSKLAPGTAVTLPLQQRTVSGFVVRQVDEPSFKLKPLSAILSDTPIPDYYLLLAEWMSEYYGCSLGDSMRLLAPSQPIKRKSPLTETPDPQYSASTNDRFTLTKDQQSALTSLQNANAQTMLLHGDTGTGKTELYVRTAEDTINSGKSVLLLVPEIALTAQLVKYFEQRLSTPVISLHSHLSVSKRKKYWLQILESTEPQLIIGPRSALFAPIAKLGLIIVDEAHEPAYKQEQQPYYHAVRVASRLSGLSGAQLILGSATPDVVDYYMADRKSAIIRMQQIALSRDAPTDVKVTVVDLKDRAQFSKSSFLSDELLAQARQTLSSGQQVLFYLNRRGTARVILCEKCAWQLLCRACDVPMVYHGDTHKARCHTCGQQQTPPHSCPNCGNPELVYRGIGTKMIEQSLVKLFPDKVIMRFDGDNTEENQAERHYDKLLSGEVQIIVGTQMMAKGFDLPNLGMVGIVVADTPLFLPDYRANERTYQLLTQVMGRVGRGHGKACVVLQTYQPENQAIASAINRDWQSFYEAELEERRVYRYPPFRYVLKLICRRKTQKGAISASEKLAAELAQNYKGIEVSSPTPAFFEKQHGNYTWHIIVRSPLRPRLVDISQNLPSGWVADLDPVSLL